MIADEQPEAGGPMDLIHPALVSGLAARGYDALTPVQVAVLDPAHLDRDLLVSAQTGSGKTVAFGIAIAPTLLAERPKFGPAERPLALVVAPTRELALQVQRELEWLYADAGITTASSVGGLDIRKERDVLRRGAHIVVGTPGRLRDHITRGALDLSALRAVVLDEADEMLDLGFREDLEFILGAAPAERRTLMFSATVPRAIAELAKTYQRDAVRVTATASTERHADIEYQMILVRPEEREQAIVNALLYFDSGSTIVFCHTREAVKHLTARLANRRFAVVTLSGELSQAERTNALQAMRNGRARVCVATDVAARGLDLPKLDLVIHADLPSKPDTLLHRSGRTGRAGRKGISVLIVPIHRRAAASRLLKLANLEAITRGPPSIGEIETRNRELILETAAAANLAEDDEKLLAAELLARVPAEQLAVLYLRQQQALRPGPEDVSEVSVVELRESRSRGNRREPTDGAGREEDLGRRPDMQGGVWFRLSLGHKHRADPKWLLPMICKAGGVTRRAVGSIKIGENETLFEISAEAAPSFADHLARSGSGEKGVTITRTGTDAGSGRDVGLQPQPDGKSRRKGSAHRSIPAEGAGSVSAPPLTRGEKPPKAKPPGVRKPKPSTAKKGWDPAGNQARKRPNRETPKHRPPKG